MKRPSILLGLILVFLLLAGCKKHKENKVEPDKEFVKYIDTKTIVTDMVPLDMVRTADQGFLLLGSSPSADFLYHRTYLLKLDKEGKFIWDGYLSQQFLNPVSEIMAKNGAYYLVCMDEITGTHIVKISDGAIYAESIAYFGEITLPLHASMTPDGGFLIVNCNLSDKWTGITKVNPNLSIAWHEEYFFNENFAADIDRHIKRETAPLPFLTGSVMNGANPTAYYFNAYYDANFSCVFVDPATGKADGYSLIGGDRAYATLRYVLPLGGNKFAFARYDRSASNHFIPYATFDITASSFVASTELGGLRFPDMEVNSRITCRRYVLAGKDVVVYGSNTRNKGVGLYVFDANSGAYLGSKAFSLETPCEMGGFSPTADGGLTVIAKTYIANRFPRVCVFKIDEDEVKKMVGG